MSDDNNAEQQKERLEKLFKDIKEKGVKETIQDGFRAEHADHITRRPSRDVSIGFKMNEDDLKRSEMQKLVNILSYVVRRKVKQIDATYDALRTMPTDIIERLSVCKKQK